MEAYYVDYIDFTPPRPEIPEEVKGFLTDYWDKVILNWKNIDNFVYDLSLKENSPLIDAGTDLSPEIGNLDKDGKEREPGAWDIGAYEHVG